jgi:hypothetical protein
MIIQKKMKKTVDFLQIDDVVFIEVHFIYTLILVGWVSRSQKH